MEDIYSKLNSALSNEVRLYFIIRNKRSNQIEYKIFKTEITEDIGNTFIDIGKKNVINRLESGDLNYVEYNPTVFLETNNVETINGQNISFLEDILRKINSADLEIFDMSQYKNIWAYLVNIKANNIEIIFFRKFTQSKILEKKGFINLFYQNGLFNKLTSPSLTIDEFIDSIYYNQKMFILNKTNFENIFSFMDKFIEEIDSKIDTLRERFLINNIDNLWDLCKSDPKKIKKFNKILKNHTFDSLNATIISQINSQYGLNLNITSDGKIDVNNKNIWYVLKLLDDDYLKSPATSINYETHSKIRR